MKKNVTMFARSGLAVAIGFVGSLFGSANPRADIPRLAELYRKGQLDLDGMITRTYSLDQINEGYQDMRDGKNIRGVISFA